MMGNAGFCPSTVWYIPRPQRTQIGTVYTVLAQGHSHPKRETLMASLNEPVKEPLKHQMNLVFGGGLQLSGRRLARFQLCFFSALGWVREAHTERHSDLEKSLI